MKVKPEYQEVFEQVATRALTKSGHDDQDRYNADAFNFMMTFARRVEELVGGGASFTIACNYALPYANPRGPREITIKQYFDAIEVLYHFWEYGERLRIWHNLKFLTIAEASAANKNGALYNPAVIPAPNGVGMAQVVSTLRDYMDAYRAGRLRFAKTEQGGSNGTARASENNTERTGD